jgi:hypothetical protein
MLQNTVHVFRTAESECSGLAEWLALELAPTIRGNKPSTVLSFSNTKYMPLLNMWNKYGLRILQDSVIRFFHLRVTPTSVTVLFYRADMLKKCMEDMYHKEFLQRFGYPVDAGIDKCLALLRQRFQHSCPHEVGLLLGIPLKDVLGFMGLSHLPLTCRGLWQIYGDPESSLSTIQCFTEDRRCVAEQLERGLEPRQLLCG